MNPFSYSDSLHLRTQKPERFSDYKRYKPFLRIEFERKCVYCRMPDGVRGEEAFGVDHYRPLSKFPRLDCEYENLFYACNTCNWRKGHFWPEPQQAAEEFIPNPCDHRMAEHLRFEGARVESVTSTGRFVIAMLFLNHPTQIEYRDFILRSIDRCLREQTDLRSILAQLDARLIASQDLGHHWLLADRSSLQDRLDRLRVDLERLTGSLLPA